MGKKKEKGGSSVMFFFREDEEPGDTKKRCKDRLLHLLLWKKNEKWEGSVAFFTPFHPKRKLMRCRQRPL